MISLWLCSGHCRARGGGELHFVSRDAFVNDRKRQTLTFLPSCGVIKVYETPSIDRG